MDISLRNNLIEVDNIIYLLNFAQNLEEIERLYDDFGLKLNKEVLKAIKEIIKSNKVDKSKLDFYFKRYALGENQFSFDRCFYRCYYFNSVRSIEEYLKVIKNTSKEEHLKFIIKTILSIKYEVNLKESVLNNSLNNTDEFLKELIDINIPSELKWNLCSAILDLDRFIDEYIELIEVCSKVFKTTLDKLNQICSNWYDDLKAKVETEGLEFLEEAFEGNNYEKYSQIYVYPRIVDAGALDTNYMDNDMYMFLGIDIYETIKIFGKNNENSWAMTALRILSESTRFKMLEMLNKKEMFSGEISESLKLSNGTISHHTMGLEFANLIESETRGNKTYYRTNKNSIDKLCDILEKEFNL